MAERALSELVVIEYSFGVPGAMCAKAMADLGAKVVKVEPSEGDPTRRSGPFPGGVPNPEASGQFLYLNANKRGITLDIQAREDYGRLIQLLASADVFVTDVSPRRADELGVDYPHLEPVNPRLVATYVTPFGLTGPYRDYKGSDLIAWHMGGMGYETPWFALTDLEKQPPLRAGGYQADYLAGWTAALAAMMAVFHRDAYGIGQMVDVSAMEAVANHIRSNFAFYTHEISKLPESRLKSHFPWIWACRDGYISVSFASAHWWESLRDIMGRPAWAEGPEGGGMDAAVANMDVLEPQLAVWMSRHTRQELYEMLQSRGVPCFPVLSMEEVTKSPQYVDRRFFATQDHPVAGRVKQPGPPARLRRTPWSLDRPAPMLGQHNAEVFGEAARMTQTSGARPAPEAQVAVAQTKGAEVERNRPLQGVRIVDFGWILSVPHCTQWLGTMGAEVIRVESQAHPEGARKGKNASTDGVLGVNRSGPWNNNNYSKLGVTLNLREPQGIELVKELVAVSDVVTENFSPDVMPRLGLNYETLRQVRPDLIMLSGSTVGVTGPERNSTGWGPNTLSYGGLAHLTGYLGGPPQNAGGNLPDYLIGVIMAFYVLSAVRHRRRTGQGQYIEVSMAETVTGLVPEAFLEYSMNGRNVERTGNHVPDKSPHNVYPCDGQDQWVAVAVSDDDEWRAMCRSVGHPQWATDSRFLTLADRKRNEAELDALMGEWTRHRSPHEAMHILQGAGVAAGPVMSTFDLMEDPHFNERGFVVEIDHPEVGPRGLAGLPAKFSAMPKLAYAPAPLLGQHNPMIFGELLGIAEDRVRQLMEDKVIY